jgi:hypothetical protein
MRRYASSLTRRDFSHCWKGGWLRIEVTNRTAAKRVGDAGRLPEPTPVLRVTCKSIDSAGK